MACREPSMESTGLSGWTSDDLGLIDDHTGSDAYLGPTRSGSGMEMDPMLSGISTGYPEYAHHVTEAEMEAVTQVMSEAAVSRITTGEFDYQAMAGAAETGESDSGAPDELPAFHGDQSAMFKAVQRYFLISHWKGAEIGRPCPYVFLPSDDIFRPSPEADVDVSLTEKLFVDAVLCDRWKIDSYISSGTFGRGWVGIDSRSNQKVFIKTFRSLNDRSRRRADPTVQEDAVRREVEVLLHPAFQLATSHPAVVSNYLCFGKVEVPQTGMTGEMFFIMTPDLCDGGELFYYLCPQTKPYVRSFSAGTARILFRMIANGVAHMHEVGCYHRDLKLENLVVTAEFDVKIMDFGSVKFRDQLTTVVTEEGERHIASTYTVGTSGYKSREANREFRGPDDQPGYEPWKLDVWSCGAILFFMVVGEVLYRARGQSGHNEREGAHSTRGKCEGCADRSGMLHAGKAGPTLNPSGLEPETSDEAFAELDLEGGVAAARKDTYIGIDGTVLPRAGSVSNGAVADGEAGPASEELLHKESGDAQAAGPASPPAKPTEIQIDLSHLGTFDPNYGKPIMPPVDDIAASATWYASGRSREELTLMVEALVTHGAKGEFIIRDKKSDAGSFALTVKEADTSLLTFLIVWKRSKGEFTIKGTGEFYPTLTALVGAYSAECRDSLGIALVPPRPYILEAAARAVPSEAPDTSSLPSWLRVDDEMKAGAQMKRRASKVRMSWTEDGKKELDFIYDVASHDRALDMKPEGESDSDDGGAVYSMAGTGGGGAPEADYALASGAADGQDPNYALASGNGCGGDGGDYALASGADVATYDLGGRSSDVYELANRQSVLYDTAQNNRQSELYDGATLHGLDATYRDTPELAGVPEVAVVEMEVYLGDTATDPSPVPPTVPPTPPKPPAEPWNKSRAVSKKRSGLGRMFRSSQK